MFSLGKVLSFYWNIGVSESEGAFNHLSKANATKRWDIWKQSRDKLMQWIGGCFIVQYIICIKCTGYTFHAVRAIMCENTPLEDWYDSYLTYFEGNTVWVPSYAGCKQEWCDGPFSTSTRWETIHILLCCDPPNSQDFHNLKRLQLPSRDGWKTQQGCVFIASYQWGVHIIYIYIWTVCM